MIEKIALSWSSGKDSALSLYYLYKEGYDIFCLLTTITTDYKRVSMHGVREELVELQAESINIPLKKVYIPKECTNAIYEETMEKVCLELKNNGVTRIGFGDIFLEDVKKYREDNLRKIGMSGIFPLWGKDSKKLAWDFINLGFKAKIVCVDSRKLSGDFAGKEFDRKLLDELPSGCDPCGENGEFHTFVYDGPVFSSAVPVKVGEKVLRDSRFYFCDIHPI